MRRPSQTSRREFLRGQSAAGALSDAVDRLLPEQPAADFQFVGADGGPDTYLVQFARRAMACQFEVYLNAGQYPEGGAAALAALDLVDRLEDQLSTYREHGEIGRLNRLAGSEPVAVEARLCELLALAQRLHAETEGAYDITSGPLSRAWGFTIRAGSIPAPDVLARALASVGTQHVELDRTAGAVRFRRPGMEINLGSIGKGYALDRCAELLATAGIEHFLLHGGHSSVLARGTRGTSAATGWLVGVRHPLWPQRRLGTLRLRDAALGTSGSGTQFFEHEGKRYGHILDPRTGWPAQGVLSATVIAPSGALADALSTAFYVMGPDAATQYSQTHPEIGCVMACPGQQSGLVDVHILGRANEIWQPLEDVGGRHEG